MTELEEYFLQPRAERIILIEITRTDGKTYYLSDTPYITEGTDSPADLIYSPIISAGGIPRVKRTLTDPLEGAVQTSYGEIEITSDLVSYRTSANARGYETMEIYRGNQIKVKLAGPRADFDYDTALTLFTGRVGRIMESHDGSVTIEMVDPIDKVRTALVPMNTYTNGGYKPLCFGRVYNLTPVLLDRATLTYQVHDGAINAVLAVRDNGVAIAHTTDLPNGKFTLLATPVGVVTCDIEGDKPSSWNSTTEHVVSRLLDMCGLTTGVLPRSYAGVPTGVVSYYMTKPEELHSVISKLVRGAGCWWSTDRAGTFKVRPIPFPQSGAMQFNGSTQYGLITSPSAINLTTFSVEAVATPDAGSDNGGIFEKTVGGVVNTHYNLFQSGTDWNWRVKPSGGATVTITTPISGAGVQDHLVGTYDGTNLRLYKNGVLAAGPTACAAPATGAGDATIGSLDPGASYEFDGTIDGVRVYSGALSAVEVADHYAGIYTGETPLVGHWDFDEGSGAVAYDMSGNGNNAALQNSPTRVAALKIAQVAYDDKTQLGAATYRTEDRVIREVKVKYRPNWTKQNQFAASASTATVEFAQTDGLFVTRTATGDESESTSVELATYFADLADAQIVGDRVLDLYKNKRKVFSFEVPVGAQRLEPGSLASVTEPVSGDTYVLSVEDIIDGLYPAQSVEAIA